MEISHVLIIETYHNHDVICCRMERGLRLKIDLPSELIEAPLSRNSLSPIWIGNTFRAGSTIGAAEAEGCEAGRFLLSAIGEVLPL
jgi:hypothetical protein